MQQQRKITTISFLLLLIFSSWFYAKSKSTTNNVHVENVNSQSNSRKQTIIEGMKRHTAEAETQSQNTATVLATNSFTLEDKQLTTQTLENRYLQALKSSKTYQDIERELGRQTHELVFDFYQAIQNHNWKLALKLYPEVSSYLPVNESFSAFIWSDAPVAVILDFIKQGMLLSGQAIGELKSRDVAVIQALIPHGLDIHAVYENAYNALMPKFTLSREAFDFFLAHNVAIAPVKGGLDALDFSLLNIQDFANELGRSPVRKEYLLKQKNNVLADNIYFTQQLLRHGAQIQPSHRQLLESIQKLNPSIYQILIEQTPELAD